MTDTSKYTGTHKHRFDEVGKGKGLEGRDSPAKGRGMVAGSVASQTAYVSGYKHEGTYSSSPKFSPKLSSKSSPKSSPKPKAKVGDTVICNCPWLDYNTCNMYVSRTFMWLGNNGIMVMAAHPHEH